MLHSNTWSLLGIYKRYHPKTVFILSGDFNQLASVSSGLPGVRHEYAGNRFSDPNVDTHTDIIHQLLARPFSRKPGTDWVLRHSMRAALCPNLRALSSDPYSVYHIDPRQYHPSRFRFDMVTLTDRNICFTNRCRDRVCQLGAEEWLKRKTSRSGYYHTITRQKNKSHKTDKGNAPPRTATWAVGMPIVCMHSQLRRGSHIKNIHTGKIKAIFNKVKDKRTPWAPCAASSQTPSNVVVHDIRTGAVLGVPPPGSRLVACLQWDHTEETTEVDFPQLGNWFMRAFCITSHSSQGVKYSGG